MEARYQERLAALQRLDDPALVDRALKGQANAFRTLVERHQGPLRTWLKRMATPNVDSDDLAQQALIKAWDKLDRWNRSGSFRSWLFGIAHHVASDSRRQVQRAQHRDDYWASGRPDATESPASALEAGLDVERLLGPLPPIQRSVLMMFHGAGFSHQEVADALGLPLGTVKSHIGRARQQILARLESGGSQSLNEEASNEPKS